jgi:HlyD family secretion protein
VWVLPQGADGRPVPGAAPVAVAVMPGISDGRNTEITAGALTEGMQVITAQATGAAK